MARTRGGGKHLSNQQPVQRKKRCNSLLIDETENEGTSLIERNNLQNNSRVPTENAQVRRPRSNRATRQRLPQNNSVLSLNDSTEPQTGEKDSRSTRDDIQIVTNRTNADNSCTGTTQSDGNKKKRARGPTCMPQIWGLNKHLDVSFNDLGQPNDQKRTSTLAHFLGTLARNGSFCPLHYTDWRLMPDSYKEDMLKEVKLRFNIRAGGERFILQSINHKWRNWKSQLKNLNFDSSVPIEDQMQEVPERVNIDQYKQMLDYWSTDKAQQLSEKKKEARAKLEIVHRMGKRSYAVMSEIMHENMGRYPTRAELFEKCCYPSNGSPTSEAVREAIEKMKEIAMENDEAPSDGDTMHDPDDAFAKIMGKDKSGRLRMYGMGVKPNDIYGGKPSRDALYRQSMEDKEEMRALKQKLEELTALMNTISHSGGQSMTRSAPVSSPVNQNSSGSISRPTRIRVGAYVKLKSLVNLNEIVATGILSAIGDVILNGRDLGPGICEVVIQSIMKNEEMLIYPTDIHETIGDSIGAPVAWPLSLILLDENEN